ncbi:acetamidase/formamidase family protein [Alteribacter natronophilus]|uniref:acetamidase/formamidase family protein n=1 Tax=Alteribacter natronophilus TaxID=2583810 RepID=UPI00110DFDC1|nr:acetamidase/formamidase family protein [Alteribacter natronophilus]TMW70742.1 acetamidase [Alteribacter natronophilus]
MIHTLKLEQSLIRGTFSREYGPVLTVDSGDTVRMTTPDIEWGYSAARGEERQVFERLTDGDCHPIIGPIAVKGASAGDVLEVRVNELLPGWYGRNWGGGGVSWQNEQMGIVDEEKAALDWTLSRETGSASAHVSGREISVAMGPFLGLMAVAPAEDGVHSTVPPRRVGGNIDCKELVTGTKLYLPVEVDGALFSCGDGHAAQGDGEVSGTAIECPMDLADVTLTVRKDMELQGPRAKTPAGWLTFGFDEDLNTAAGTALRDMVTLIGKLYGVTRSEAAALASTVVDLRVTQVVNGVKGVHAVLPDGAVR